VARHTGIGLRGDLLRMEEKLFEVDARVGDQTNLLSKSNYGIFTGRDLLNDEDTASTGKVVTLGGGGSCIGLIVRSYFI
jgi:hypothetical protein